MPMTPQQQYQNSPYAQQLGQILGQSVPQMQGPGVPQGAPTTSTPASPDWRQYAQGLFAQNRQRLNQTAGMPVSPYMAQGPGVGGNGYQTPQQLQYQEMLKQLKLLQKQQAKRSYAPSPYGSGGEGNNAGGDTGGSSGGDSGGGGGWV